MNDLLLKDFHTATTFQMWAIVIALLILGIMIGIIILGISTNPNDDSYFRGQIDAIRGIIKWELKSNEDGEEIWTEIKKSKLE